MNRQNNASVRKHRAKMAAKRYARMEVTIGSDVINFARDLAKQKQWPFWCFVERVIMAYADAVNAATGNANETGNGK